MKIQYISYNQRIHNNTDYQIKFSTLSNPLAFDLFDVNIISLQDEELWSYDKDSRLTINSFDDFMSIGVSIRHAKKSYVIVCFPQNYDFTYYLTSGRYNKFRKIKDMLSDFGKIVSVLLPEGNNFTYVYENSLTKCCETEMQSAFYFNTFNSMFFYPLTRSVGGDHTTTLRYKENIIYTTLDVSRNFDHLKDFLMSINIDHSKTVVPDWVKDIDFYDDVAQKQIVCDTEHEIDALQSKIGVAKRQLDKNLYYKSILFESGTNLVKPVMKIFEQFTNTSLENFVDEKGEDFRICLNDVTFIGEVKGITSNVKSENVSQLDVHCQIYLDKLYNENKTENIKGLLIINPFRNKSLTERESVHINQIKLAERNGSLIITTEVLLHLYECFLNDEISGADVVNLLKNKIGILSISDFKEI